jgi:hypothetical protein
MLLGLAAAAFPAAAAAPAAGVPAPPVPLAISRAAGAISIDGDLSDPGWQGAAKIDSFYETSPGDNLPASVPTTVWLTYDDRYLYIGVRCDDPDPSRIRAPYVDRDNVLGTDDNVAVFLDTRNDRRSAVELRVNPRGIQTDGVYNDANQNEDFSPDFFYDTAARITSFGWTAEYRVPFSSLRYPRADPQTWGILIWRNYPRAYRYAFHSAPIPRDSTCFICHAHEITGLSGLPSSNHLVAAPYGTAHQLSSRADPADPRSPLINRPLGGDGGIDVKWSPTGGSAIDGTFRPDFSQVESDVAQLTVNQRFALTYPEKRPFFLESVDLLDTPIPAVYTRSITSPEWGVRATDKEGSAAYTLLVAEDRGGGVAILPGPLASGAAPQDFHSTVAVGRLRQDFGTSFAGLLLTDREVAGGGHNRVIGPDFLWRPEGSDAVTGEVLYSDTRNPDRPDLSPLWQGQHLSSFNAFMNWTHQTRGLDWSLTGRDVGDGFRADVGFVPQVGYREGSGSFGLRFWPTGLFNYVRAYVTADAQSDSGGRTIDRNVYPGVLFWGRLDLVATAELHDEQVATIHRLLDQRYVFYSLQVDPGRRLPRILLTGKVGQAVDFVNERTGNGASLSLEATVRPADHLELLADGALQWLDVDAGQRSHRLFTATVERLKATWIFSARSLLRAIVERVDTQRNPSLYAVAVPPHDGSLTGSILYAYKLSWQSVLFVGYGDDRVLTADGSLLRTDHSFFLKLSYAFQF